MAKKLLKISKPKATPKKTVSRVSFDREILQAIHRKQTNTGITELFDQSLPDDMRFAGIVSSATKKNPTVNQTDAPVLSPFILELRHAQTNAGSGDPAYYEEEIAPIRLNLLSTDLGSQTHVTKEPIVDTSKDLILATNHAYAEREIKKDSPSVWMHQVLFPTITKETLESVPLKIFKSQENFSHEVFLPKLTPKNILAYFDLPEEDQVGDGDDLVDLEDLIFSSESIEDTKRGLGTPPIAEKQVESKKPFVFPKLSFPQFSSSFFFPNEWQRAIAAFVLVSFAFVLPLHAMQVINNLRDAKTSAQANGQLALASLKDAAGANLVTDPAGANADFTKASSQFGKASESISNLGSGVTLLLSTLGPTQKTFKTNTALLKMGQELSLAGARMTSGMSAMQQELHPTPSSRLQILQMYLQSALPHLTAAEDAMNAVDVNVIDSANRDTFTKLSSTLPALVDSTKEFVSLGDTLQSILGTNQTKKYLLIFQNNTEIRPTGGFMGSFAELSVHNGVMENLTVPAGGTYDLQGQLRTPLVAPWPLQLLAAKWEFQDANWFPDFPTSARQMIQFYKDSGGSDVDGVIAVNANVVTDLLGLLGPIEMPDYGQTISQDNFLATTQQIVETGPDKALNKPKAFIGDLAPKLIDKSLHGSPETFLELAGAVNNAFNHKDIQCYFPDENLERTIIAHNWGGEMKQTDKDYLMVVNTNLGGEKTDGVISEKIHTDVNIDENGVITNTLTISRTHNGFRGDAFTGVNNVNYVRVYVPKGSVLKSSNGFRIPNSILFKIPDATWNVDKNLQYADDSFSVDKESGTQSYEENGKTVFGNWTQTKPGETTTATFVYTLPFTFRDLTTSGGVIDSVRSFADIPRTDSYSLLIQKQSGVLNRHTSITVHIPDSMKTRWSSAPLTDTLFSNDTDGFFGALLEHSL